MCGNGKQRRKERRVLDKEYAAFEEMASHFRIKLPDGSKKQLLECLGGDRRYWFDVLRRARRGASFVILKRRGKP